MGLGSSSRGAQLWLPAHRLARESLEHHQDPRPDVPMSGTGAQAANEAPSPAEASAGSPPQSAPGPSCLPSWPPGWMLVGREPIRPALTHLLPQSPAHRGVGNDCRVNTHLFLTFPTAWKLRPRSRRHAGGAQLPGAWLLAPPTGLGQEWPWSCPSAAGWGPGSAQATPKSPGGGSVRGDQQGPGGPPATGGSVLANVLVCVFVGTVPEQWPALAELFCSLPLPRHASSSLSTTPTPRRPSGS